MIVNEREFSSRHTQFWGLALNTTCCSQSLGAAYNYWAPQNNGTWEMWHFQTGICLTGTVQNIPAKNLGESLRQKRCKWWEILHFRRGLGNLLQWYHDLSLGHEIRVRVPAGQKNGGESTTRKEVDKVKIMGGYPNLESWENMICDDIYLFSSSTIINIIFWLDAGYLFIVYIYIYLCVVPNHQAYLFFWVFHVASHQFAVNERLSINTCKHVAPCGTNWFMLKHLVDLVHFHPVFTISNSWGHYDGQWYPFKTLSENWCVEDVSYKNLFFLTYDFW